MLRPTHLLTTQLEAPTTTIPTLGWPSILPEVLLKALKDNDKADIKSKDSFHENLLNPSQMNNAFYLEHDSGMKNNRCKSCFVYDIVFNAIILNDSIILSH